MSQINESPAHDVFISHSTKDETVANTICTALEARGVKCWIAPRDIQAGADYGRSIVHAVKTTPTMVLVFSSSADNSEHVINEVEMAMEAKATVAPVRINRAPCKIATSKVVWRDM